MAANSIVFAGLTLIDVFFIALFALALVGAVFSWFFKSPYEKAMERAEKNKADNGCRTTWPAAFDQCDLH